MAKLHAPGSIHEALDALMVEIEAKTGTNGYQAAADLEDVTKFTIYKQVDPDTNVEMSFARVVRLSRHFGAMAALNHLAGQMGCVVVPRGEAVADANLITHLSALACESSQAIEAIAVGIADQDLDADELTRIAKEARDLREAAAATELAAQAKLDALRSNVASLRAKVA